MAELAKYGFIEPTTRDYAAATVLPVKKDDEGNYGNRRICGDYRVLNLQTGQDRSPMPIPKDIFDRMEGCQYISIMDMRQGLNQIEMIPEHKERTTF